MTIREIYDYLVRARRERVLNRASRMQQITGLRPRKRLSRSAARCQPELPVSSRRLSHAPKTVAALFRALANRRTLARDGESHCRSHTEWSPTLKLPIVRTPYRLR